MAKTKKDVWAPKPGSKAEKIGKLIEKGLTVKEVIEKTGFERNTVVARFSDYRRINGLAWTGKVYNKQGELVAKETLKPVKKAKAEPKAKKTTTKKKVKAAKPAPAPAKKAKSKKKEVGPDTNEAIAARMEKYEAQEEPVIEPVPEDADTPGQTIDENDML